MKTSLRAIGVELKCGIRSQWDIANSSSLQRELETLLSLNINQQKQHQKPSRKCKCQLTKPNQTKPFIFQLIVGFKHAKCLRSQALCIAFRTLVCPSDASTSIANFQLIVDLVLNPNREGVEYIWTISCNKLRWLIGEYIFSLKYEGAHNLLQPILKYPGWFLPLPESLQPVSTLNPSRLSSLTSSLS